MKRMKVAIEQIDGAEGPSRYINDTRIDQLAEALGEGEDEMV